MIRAPCPYFFVQFLKGCEKLKGKLLKLLLIMCLCLVPTVGTYAADSTSSDDEQDWYDAAPELDDKGRRIKGTFDCLHEQKNDKVDKQWVWKGFFAASDGCAYWLKHDVQSSGSLSWTPYEFVCTSKSLNNQSYRLFYVYNDNKNPDLSNSKISTGFERYYYDYYGEEDTGHFSSTLPIFKAGDTDAINTYLENGDTSGAINDDNTENDGSIEPPHDLKISGEFSFGTIQKVFHDKLLSFSWSIPEMKDLTYDAQFKFNYLDKKQNTENGIDSSWYDWRDNIKYNYDSAAMILDVVNKVQGVNWLSSARTSLGLSMDDCYSITFRVRNRKGNKVSNWVEIQLGQDGKATARETDLNGNTQKSDEYNEDSNPSTNDANPGSNDFYDWVKDNTDNANNSDSSTSSNGLTSSIKDLKAFITSGFGLLGSNGIIALMSGLFSYIPASVWTLIKAAISMTILVMLIGLLKNLVFG